MKRILSGIFAALLILCALPVAAFAEQQSSDIDPITVQPISASGGEIVRPTWLAYGPITQYPTWNRKRCVNLILFVPDNSYCLVCNTREGQGFAITWRSPVAAYSF